LSFRFDEFGFELANTESEQRNNDPTAEKPPIECSSHRFFVKIFVTTKPCNFDVEG
jgi:hypothetical protein